MPPTSSATLPPWSPPAPITIAILGAPRLIVHDRELPLRGGGKREALLLQLAMVHRNPIARGALLTALWPHDEPTVAGNALNTLTSELNKKSRQAIQDTQGKGQTLICCDEGSYRFNGDAGVGTDIEYFDRWCVEGLRRLHIGDVDRGLPLCHQALALYRGDVSGDGLTALLERERLRSRLLDLLTALADYHVLQMAWHGALTYLHHLLNVEPCREDAHRQIMRCYVKLGYRGQALRQFQFCAQLLDQEFAAPPEPATVTLFDQIRMHPESVV